ncbi:uncharacterized protein J4E87_004155 [Alternaria ethzedia]|uniref:uncharacterized protein n=1 Tax=Alternaria ethzedia TaxID=181014 RepID=UPI0020C22C37|nr:uncharacterized protein J4E87_004155 [Alternaria ethzedia]KAI4627591.1 hypothetical protein J4E87_004155 [Alternaria ethzedia]
MAEREYGASLTTATEASNIISVLKINVDAYPYRSIRWRPRHNASDAVKSTPDASKIKARSDSLVTGTETRQTAKKVSDSTVTLPASGSDQPAPAYGPSFYFRDTFFTFNPNTVDLNRIGIAYEYGDYYYICLELPHPSSGVFMEQSGFVPRSVVGPYLAVEWASLTKEHIGEYGIAVCGDDRRWKVHGQVLRAVQNSCRKTATALYHTPRWLSQCHEEEVRYNLGRWFKQAVHSVYQHEKEKTNPNDEEADKFMEEFMVFD